MKEQTALKLLDTSPQPPVAKVVPHETTLFGDTRADNYFWLRDRKDPSTIPYLEAENAYHEAVMAPTKDRQTWLYSEMLGRIKQTDESAPVKRGDYFYYQRTEEGKPYAIYCRKKGSLEAPEQVLLDGNALGEGKPYFRLGNFAPSPNHKLLAYSVDFTGDESYTIRVKDLDSGNLLADEIPNTYYSLEWANDNATFFYTTLDQAKRPHQVFRHIVGQSDADPVVYHEPDQRFTVEVIKTLSRAFILIQIDSPLTSEVRCLDANQPLGEFVPVLARVHEVEYDLTHRGDSFFIRTNDGAKTFRVVEAPVRDPSRPNWKEMIPGRASVTIESVVAFHDHLVVEERDGGLIKLRIQSFSNSTDAAGETHYVEFPEGAYKAELGANVEFDTPLLRFHYSSLVTPSSVFDYDRTSRTRRLVKQQDVLGGYDPSRYATERLYAKAADGVDVPISLVYKRGFEPSAAAPMLLYGYGSYGISIDAEFRSDRVSLLDLGFVYAIAHIRGGGDLGKTWHESGRMFSKKNTFTDFIACAEHLIARRYTSSNRLAIMGGSAGGLLIGAVVNMRPDLFAAVVASVPFVDALNTELDATLPLTVGEWEEWGNPAEKPYYDCIKSYAPYENVTAQYYPHLLVTAGLNDPRVSYWEPAKWVAKLRTLKRDSNLLLLKTNMGSGHFGASGRYEYLKETAFNYAFLMAALDVDLGADLDTDMDADLP